MLTVFFSINLFLVAVVGKQKTHLFLQPKVDQPLVSKQKNRNLSILLWKEVVKDLVYLKFMEKEKLGGHEDILACFFSMYS